MKNYYLVGMDFEETNFVNLKNEYDENKQVMWKIPSTKKVKKDDIIYFYVTNLGVKTEACSRILFRGEVAEDQKQVKYNEVYMRSNSEKMIWGSPIVNIKALKPELLKDSGVFNLGYIKKKNFGHIPRGGRWPHKLAKGNAYGLTQEVIDELEVSFESGRNPFKSLIEMFDVKCFFDGHLKREHRHKTIVKLNGLKYYEYHHFIQKSTKQEKFKSLIDMTDNLIPLCATCHREIHNGSTEAKKEMLNIIYHDDRMVKVRKELIAHSGEDSESVLYKEYLTKSEMKAELDII